MTRQEEISQLLGMIDQMHKSFPSMLTEISQLNCGTLAVMRYLYRNHNQETVHAGDLSRYIGVSTARMTAMLKKLEKDQLIVRGKECLDARTTTVHLTKKGIQYTQLKKQQIENLIEQTIDRIGYQRLSEMIQTVQELCNIFSNKKYDFDFNLTNKDCPTSVGR